MYSFVSIIYFKESNNSSLGLDWDSKMVTTDLLESEDNVAKSKMDFDQSNVHIHVIKKKKRIIMFT